MLRMVLAMEVCAGNIGNGHLLLPSGTCLFSATPAPPCLKFNKLEHRGNRILAEFRTVIEYSDGFEGGSGSNRRIHTLKSFASSQGEAASSFTNNSDSDIDKDVSTPEFKGPTEEPWETTVVDCFNEQALNMKSISQKACDMYSMMAILVLKKIAEKLKNQLNKAENELTSLSNEVVEDGKEYLSAVTGYSNEAVKEVLQTFSSSDDLVQFSEMQDIQVKILHGLLVFGIGFFSFMVAGSISAVRFGVIPGFALSTLCISSLKAHKRGESIASYQSLQTAIVFGLFLRQMFLLFKRRSIFTLSTALFSGAMWLYYMEEPKLEAKLKSEVSRGGERQESASHT